MSYGDKIELVKDATGKPIGLVVDPELFQRITAGTDFQRTLNVLSVMEQIMIDSLEEVLASLTPHHQGMMLKGIRQRLKRYVGDEPPPGADQDAIRLFFDE